MNKEQQAQQTAKKQAQRPSPVQEAAPTAELAPTLVTLQTPGQLHALPPHTTRAIRQASVLRMQQQQGNAAVQRLLASAQTPAVQRCGGETHAGCGCASCSDDEEMGGTAVPSIQRQTEEAAVEKEEPQPEAANTAEQSETANENPAAESPSEKDVPSPAEAANENPAAANTAAAAEKPAATAPAAASGAKAPATQADAPAPTAVANGSGAETPAPQANLTSLVSSGQAPDSSSRILELAQQARQGGGEPASLTVESPDLNNILQDCRISPTPEESTIPMSLDPLNTHVEVERERLLLSASLNRQQVMADAQTEQMALLQAIETETARLQAVYARAREQVQMAGDSARAELESNRTTQITAINAAAETQLINLPLLVEQKKKELRQSGEQKAVAAEAFGQAEAQRAITGCATKAAAARQLGEDKATQYSSYDEAADIARAARKMAGDVANGITNSGQDMANTARQDMARLAAKFRQDAAQSAGDFGNMLSHAQNEITRERDEATRVINQVTDNTLSQISTLTTQILAQLQANEQEAMAKLSTVGQMALPEYDQLAQATCARIDQDTAVAIAQIESFAFSQAAPQLSQMQGAAGEEAQANVCTQISQNTDDFINQMGTAVANTQQSYQQHTMEVHAEVTAYVDGLTEQVGNVTNTFETEIRNIVTHVLEETQNTADKSVKNIEKVGTDLEAELQKTIDQHTSQWDKELTEGQNTLRQKIDDGLAEQDRALIDLARAIDEKAEEIEHASWLDAIGDFFSSIGGFISGFLRGFLGIIGSVLAAVFDFVWGLITDLVVWLIDVVSRILSFLWDVLLAILTFIWGVIVWVVFAVIWVLGQIVNLLLTIVNWIAGWFGGWPWLQDKLQSLRETLAMIGSFLLDPLTGDFAGCDDAQKEKLKRSTTQAVLMGNSALAKLSVSPLDAATKTQFKKFFMSDAPEHIALARSRLGEAVTGLQSNPTDMKCEPPGSLQCKGANAYTSWNAVPFVSLHFCSDFINSKGEREIGLVVLHEATHKYAWTNDHAYFGAIFSLSTADALDNADTYEQFVDAVA